VGEFETGVGEFETGVGEFETGVGEFETGVGEFETGVGEFETGVGEFETGVGEFESGAGEFESRVGDIESGVGKFESRVGPGGHVSNRTELAVRGLTTSRRWYLDFVHVPAAAPIDQRRGAVSALRVRSERHADLQRPEHLREGEQQRQGSRDCGLAAEGACPTDPSTTL
jgi:hypothetical protein